MFGLFMTATAAAPAISIELPTAVSAAAWIVAALLGIIVWFLRREIGNNNEAHAELRGDVKKLLEGQGRLNDRIDSVRTDVQTDFTRVYDRIDEVDRAATARNEALQQELRSISTSLAFLSGRQAERDTPQSQ